MDRRKRDLGRVTGPVQVDEHVARAALATIAINAVDLHDYALQVQSLGLVEYLPARLRGLVGTYEVHIPEEEEEVGPDPKPPSPRPPVPDPEPIPPL